MIRVLHWREPVEYTANAPQSKEFYLLEVVIPWRHLARPDGIAPSTLVFSF